MKKGECSSKLPKYVVVCTYHAPLLYRPLIQTERVGGGSGDIVYKVGSYMDGMRQLSCLFSEKVKFTF